MEVRVCNKCKKLFNYFTGDSLCNNCKDETENLLKEIKIYIKEHNSCTVSEISTTFKIPISKIMQWVRDECLEFTKNSGINLKCERCETIIYTGKYCGSCKVKTLNELNNVYINPQNNIVKDKEAKMRFLKK